MIQVEENYMGASRHFPGQRPLFGPTPAKQELVDEFLRDYYTDLEAARPTMPEFVFQAIKSCVEHTALQRGVQNRLSFDGRKVRNLATIDQSLLKGYDNGVNTFDQTITFMEAIQSASAEGMRYTPKPHLRDAYYPEMRTEARDAIVHYSGDADKLHGATISKQEIVSQLNVSPRRLSLDGIVLYSRLDHGYVDTTEALHVREKVHNLIRFDEQSPLYDLSPGTTGQIRKELPLAFSAAAAASQDIWTAILHREDEAFGDHIVSNPEHIAGQHAKQKFAEVFLAEMHLLRELTDEAIRDEYHELPRWIVPITTQMYVHRVSESSRA